MFALNPNLDCSRSVLVIAMLDTTCGEITRIGAPLTSVLRPLLPAVCTAWHGLETFAAPEQYVLFAVDQRSKRRAGSIRAVSIAGAVVHDSAKASRSLEAHSSQHIRQRPSA